MRSITYLLIIISLAAFVSGCNETGTPRSTDEIESIAPEKSAADGILAAEKDIAVGKLVNWGLPLPSPPWAGLLQQYCEEKGITLKSASSEVVNSEFMVAYNKRMSDEMVSRFGVTVADLDEQAYVEYEKQRKAAQQQ